VAALSAATTRIRLGTLVTGITYRPPALLATEAVTVDHVSNGRLEIGLGAAWNGPEHRALGFDFPRTGERLRRLEEAIEVMKLMMTSDRATFEGRFYRLQNADYNPKPVQRPHPPIWIGGAGERVTIPMVGRHADAWHAQGPVGSYPRKLRILDEAAERAGRDPQQVLRAASLSLSQPWDGVRADAEELRQMGFSYLVVSWPTEGRGHLETFVERVMPELVA